MKRISKEAFDKFFLRYQNQKEAILEQLQNSGGMISNLSESIAKVLELSTKLTTVWTSRELKVVERLQKLLFPEGIYYNKETGHFEPQKSIPFLSLLQTQS